MSMISKIYNSTTFRRELYARKEQKTVDRPPPVQCIIMRWIPARSRYEVQNGFRVKDQLRKIGFQFDPELKRWWTDRPKKAIRAIKLADAATKKMLVYLMTH